MAQRTLACTACHGKQGRAGPDGYYPRLAGKPAGYLYNQLLNFRDGRRRNAAMRYLVALILVVIFVFPVYWLFIISFKTPDEIFAFPPVWYPKSIQFANYAVLFKDGDAATVGNSLILASVLNQPSFEAAVSHRVAARLGHPAVPADLIEKIGKVRNVKRVMALSF